MEEIKMEENKRYLGEDGTEWLVVCVDGGAAFASSGTETPHSLFSIDGVPLVEEVAPIIAEVAA